MPHQYLDKSHFRDLDAQRAALKGSQTVYVGNMSFYTTEAQIYAAFEAIGPIKRVIMGLAVWQLCGLVGPWKRGNREPRQRHRDTRLVSTDRPVAADAYWSAAIATISTAPDSPQ